MSCWVVPMVAAEIWGVSVNQVLESIRSGRIESKVELGFVLVDAMPSGGRAEQRKSPPTFVAVEEETNKDEAFAWKKVRQRVAKIRRAPESMQRAAA